MFTVMVKNKETGEQRDIGPLEKREACYEAAGFIAPHGEIDYNIDTSYIVEVLMEDGEFESRKWIVTLSNE